MKNSKFIIYIQFIDCFICLNMQFQMNYFQFEWITKINWVYTKKMTIYFWWIGLLVLFILYIPIYMRSMHAEESRWWVTWWKVRIKRSPKWGVGMMRCRHGEGRAWWGAWMMRSTHEEERAWWIANLMKWVYHDSWLRFMRSAKIHKHA